MSFSKLLSVTAMVMICFFSFSTAQVRRLPPPPPSQSQSLTNALDTLSDSGNVAMSLTTELIADTLLHSTTSLTIFSPPDSAFAASGQPSLPRLFLQFSPLALSISALLSLPVGSRIPNLSSSGSLYITTDSEGSQLSINGVNVSSSPIFDDGSVVVFAVDDFFAANFTPPLPAPTNPSSVDVSACKLRPFSLLNQASEMLKSRGYTIMASFLDLQLLGFINTSPNKLTVFAPADEALIQFSGNVMMYQSLLMRHVLPCVLKWTELNELGKGRGSVFENYVNEFSMNVTSSNGEVLVNGIRISTPDMYQNDWIVIHGLNEMIPLPSVFNFEKVSARNNRSYFEVSLAPDHSEF